MRSRLFGGLLVLACLLGASARPDAASAQGIAPGSCPGCRFDFGSVVQGTSVTHEFALRNDSGQPLRIAGVQLSPPLQLAKMPAVIPPNGAAKLKLSLDSANLEGDYSGQLVVMLDDPLAEPRTFTLVGKVTPGIEILPQPAFFMSTSKGVAKSASLEIINHEHQALDLTLPNQANAPYRLALQAIKPGRHYRLTATIPAGAPAGRSSHRLELKSSSAARPVVYVGMNTIVHERVYTFPETVDFGQLTLRELNSAQAGQVGAAQTLMVYQTGGNNFTLRARSWIHGLALAAERGPNKDRVQVTVSLLPGKIAPGPIRGTISLQTNDPAFPTLTVPVTGEIVAE
jgi:hypothetical protein